MAISAIRQFNWLDIFVLILLFRIGYIAIKNGLTIELFKLLGVICAIYLSLHYYKQLSSLLSLLLGREKAPLRFLDFFSFVVLALSGYLIFLLLRMVFYRFIKMEATPNLNKWGGFILGLVRLVFTVSLIIFTLLVSDISYLKNSVNNAYSGKKLSQVAPVVYSALWNKLTSKFMTHEKFNEVVLEVQAALTQQ